MAYTAWSVVFGEQPTAAKWNQLGANDAGFKDGTNIDNLAIVTRHLNTNAVTAEKLATNAILIGGNERTSTVTPSGTTETTIQSVTVTVPAGGRDLLLMITAPQIGPDEGTGVRTQINFKEGSTVLSRYYHRTSNAGEVFFHKITAPSAGSHTYSVTSTRDQGSSNVGWYADNTAPSMGQLIALMI